MKRSNIRLIVLITIIAAVFSSCERNNDIGINTNSLNDLAGIYYGQFTPVPGQGDAVPGTVDVENAGNSQLNVHCLSDDLDTFIFVNAYDDGDSIMVCDTSVDIEDDHNCMSTDKTMMHMGDDHETEWMHYMEAAPDSSNIRFGGFDMTSHSFFCDLNTVDGVTFRFTGNKKQ